MGRCMAVTDLVVALTGASGAPYGVRLLEVLLQAGRTVHLSISPAAVEVMERELNRTIQRLVLDGRHGDLPMQHGHGGRHRARPVAKPHPPRRRRASEGEAQVD